MRRRISKIAAAICAIVGSLTSPALGQNQKGLNEKSTSQTRRRLEDASNFQETIFSGTVLDPVGAVIPSAIVLLQNQITKDIQQTTANENGLFQFTGMAPGKYLSK
ncbi:MAG: carboxypeptidase-like regulatory domain-containing protein [Pyrinomonadaceae bacterium]